MGLCLEIKVRYFTVLRETVGKREETFSFPDDAPVTVDLVLKTLSQKYGSCFTEYVYGESGEPRGFLQFLINGVSVAALNGLVSVLGDGDVLAILPPVGGG